MTLEGFKRARELDRLIWVGDPQFTKVVAWRKLPDIYTEEEQ